MTIKLSGKQKTTWDWVSKYIRLRDSDENGWCKCCTCDAVKNWKEMQAGHFISRRHNETAWDEKNIDAQCVSCNGYNHGEQYQHSVYIDKKYGEGTAANLKIKSKITKKNPTDEELDDIKKHYKELISKLDNKNLLKDS